uniref:Uncharacterized protein n=1 Tax=Anguilla anguilla TaxID=7936 RepID=A0A0E9SRX0_ANGAN
MLSFNLRTCFVARRLSELQRT